MSTWLESTICRVKPSEESSRLSRAEPTKLLRQAKPTELVSRLMSQVSRVVASNRARVEVVEMIVSRERMISTLNLNPFLPSNSTCQILWIREQISRLLYQTMSRASLKH